MKCRRGKRLIEISMPLEAINKAIAREESVRHGHPSPLYSWWARRAGRFCSHSWWMIAWPDAG
jgi:putative DNA methylase